MSENLIIERKIFLQSKRHPERNIIMERDIYNNITFIENGIIENISKKINGKWEYILDFPKPYWTHKELKDMCQKIIERLEGEEMKKLLRVKLLKIKEKI
jgi:hypothetical protein